MNEDLDPRFFGPGKDEPAPPRRVGPEAVAWIGRLCFVLCPFAALLLVEKLSGRSAFMDLSLSRFLLNLAIYYFTATVFWLITGRARLSAALTLALSWAAGMANCYALRLWGRPMVPGDLPALGAAGADLRPDNLQIMLTMAVALALVVLAVFPHQKERAPLRLSSFFAGAACAAFVVVLFASPVPDALNLRSDGAEDGFALHYALCLREQAGSVQARRI